MKHKFLKFFYKKIRKKLKFLKICIFKKFLYKRYFFFNFLKTINFLKIFYKLYTKFFYKPKYFKENFIEEKHFY